MSRALLSWKALAGTMLAFVFLGAAVPSLVGENPPQAPTLKAKVFRLKYCDPNEIEQVLQSLLDPNNPPQMPLNIPGAGGPAPGNLGATGVGGTTGTYYFPGAPGAPGGGLGALGVGGAALGALGAGGFGGLGGMPNNFQVAVDARTRAVIVRASEKNLQLTADLISVLDLAKGKAMPEVKTLKALPLKHADAGEIMNALQNAGVEARMVALGEAKMLVVAGSDEAMKEVADLVKDLDVPTPPELKPEEQRKLFSGENPG